MPTPSEETEDQTLDIKILLASFLKIEPQSDAFASTFYDILFKKYPQVKPLFSETDMNKQKAKLIESLQLVLGNIHNPEAFTSILKNLGKRHVSYGAVLTDYPLIGDALLQALERHLGQDWNPTVKNTWTLAYQTIAELMTEGAQTVSTNNVNLFVNLEVKAETNSPNNIPIDDISTSVDHQSTNSSTGSGSNKAILFTGISLAILGGYIGWNFIQSQKNNSTQPSPVERISK